MRSRTQAAGGPGSPPEATLFRQAQAGCRDSLNRLRARHDGLVQAVVRRSGFGELAFTEVVHLGRIGLWRAVLHYTPERGLAFSTYAGRRMRNEILHVTRAGAGRKAWPVLSLVVLSDRMLDSLVEQETQWIRQSLRQLVARLPERLRYVIEAYYGLHGQPASTYAAIGLQRGRFKQRVCQLHTEARVWLRPPTRRPCAVCSIGTPWRIINGPRTWRTAGYNVGVGAMAADLTAAEQRAHDTEFIAMCQ